MKGSVSFPFLLLAFSLLSACTIDGEALFREKGCDHCHRFRGVGGQMGPDLTPVAARRSADSLKKKIRTPSSDNSSSRMPSFPSLSRRELAALVTYLQSEEALGTAQ